MEEKCCLENKNIFSRSVLNVLPAIEYSSDCMLLTKIYFINNQGQASALKVACIFRIFRAESCLTVAQFFNQINKIKVYSNDISAFIIDIPLVKDQRSFYETRTLASCINIKVLNQVNRKQLNFLKTFLEYMELYIAAY